MIIRSICFEPTGPQSGRAQVLSAEHRAGKKSAVSRQCFGVSVLRNAISLVQSDLWFNATPSSQPKQDRVISLTRWVAMVTHRVISVTRGGRRHHLLGNDHYPLGNHDYPLGSDTYPSGNRPYPLGGRRYPLGNDNSLPAYHTHPRWCAKRGGQRTDGGGQTG